MRDSAAHYRSERHIQQEEYIVIVVRDATELASVLQRAAHQLRTEGDHSTADLAEVLYRRAVALAEHLRNEVTDLAAEVRDRSAPLGE